jgi:sialate O-acetylesterase
MTRFFCFALLIFMTLSTMAGDLRLAPLFQENMVLQRDQKLPVWGWGKAGAEVEVKLAEKTEKTKVDENGTWKVVLPARKSGEGVLKFSVKSGSESIEFKNVVMGEVWICSGQSNMQMGYGGVPEVKKMAASAQNVRTFKVTQDVSFEEADSCKGSWQASAPGSAVAAGFACYLQKAIDVPVGIILTCWGSSSIEGWMPLDMTEKLPHFKKEMEVFKANDIDQVNAIKAKKKMTGKDNVFLRTRPNILYNKMMHPLIPFACRGIVWYQGEANTKSMESMVQYGKTLPMWVERYRREWGNEKLHFIPVMLPGFGRNFTKGTTLDDVDAQTWAWMRDSQLKILNLKNTAVANTIDLGDVKNIHPKDKAPIGERLALLARRDVLGEDILAEGPVYKSLKIKGDKVELSFTSAKGLKTKDGEVPKAFWLSGDNKEWMRASAKIDGEVVVLTNDKLKSPKYVRYAFAGMPQVNLVNEANLPARPFRTDSFQP